MNTIPDKDIMNALLSNHKLNASALTTLVLESSDQKIRNDASAFLNRIFSHQKMIFDYMSQKGWYQTHPANPQNIAQAQQTINQ